MKNSIFLFITLVGLLFISCDDQSKDEIAFKESQLLITSDITGTWNWLSTDGGIGFHIHNTPASTGKTITLSISEDYQYEIKENDVSKSKGTYTLILKNSIYSGNPARFIEISDDNYINQHVVLNGIISIADEQQLNIADNFHDGIASQFSKQ